MGTVVSLSYSGIYCYKRPLSLKAFSNCQMQIYYLKVKVILEATLISRDSDFKGNNHMQGLPLKTNVINYANALLKIDCQKPEFSLTAIDNYAETFLKATVMETFFGRNCNVETFSTNDSHHCIMDYGAVNLQELSFLL